jgi:tRNA threonylcarbamoyladenosine biosynthesis protein TsaB
MLVLAVDTSRQSGSVTLARGDATSLQILQGKQLDGGMFSAQLVPAIAEVLALASVTKSEIDGFAVCGGPGSFTGLRIGLAAIKGLAEVLRKPVATVSSLEVIAATAGADRVIAMTDASRAEVYLGEFERSGDSMKCMREALCTGEQAARIISSAGASAYSPDASVVEAMKREGVSVKMMEYGGSAMVARLGAERLAKGKVVALEALDARYVRQDDSLFFTKK